MPLLRTVRLSPQFEHELDLRQREEIFRFYAEQRRAYCGFLELLDLWLEAPYCESCIMARWDYDGELPDCTPDTWEDDLEMILGDDRLVQEIRTALSSDETHGPPCRKCHHTIFPPEEDLYVVRYHLEEHYGIPLETPGQRTPSKRLQAQILKLYDGTCFNCGEPEDLHIDHILPRSKGGDAAFRNLQPLCSTCGQLKGDREPEEVSVTLSVYFEEASSGAYGAMFW